jgi:DNA-binding transcriptional regulator GbsR (MarR family)
MKDENASLLKRIGELEKRVNRLEEVLNRFGLLQTQENEDVRSEWYFGTKGFFRWVVEKVMHRKWRDIPSEAMDYLSTLSEKEKEKLREQWLRECKEYAEELKHKGEL